MSEDGEGKTRRAKQTLKDKNSEKFRKTNLSSEETVTRKAIESKDLSKRF